MFRLISLAPSLRVGLVVVSLLLAIAVLIALAVAGSVAAVAGGGAQVGHAIEDHAEHLGARAVH